MKTIIYTIAIMMTINTFRGYAEGLDKSVVDVIRQNVSDQLAKTPDVPDHYALCLKAFNEKIDSNELSRLTGYATNESKDIAGNSFFWLTALTASIYVQDQDVERLIHQASGSHRLSSLAALNILSKIQPNKDVESLFYARFVSNWENAKETTSDMWSGLESSIIADGLAQHDSGSMVHQIELFVKKRILNPSMRAELFRRFLLHDHSQMNVHRLLIDLLKQEVDPSSLSVMLDSARDTNNLDLINLLGKHIDSIKLTIDTTLNETGQQAVEN
jgi:hypothetical protein